MGGLARGQDRVYRGGKVWVSGCHRSNYIPREIIAVKIDEFIENAEIA
ncbi:hypothetical protein IV454_04950 [Massilia antarctica]|uniref:Uncharacterized protein n=1 Tax=Massilia antarctica TaxID=2765360 RepID=A0AA48WL96_9BURK|nr:hypothetical protein [Massilia antarctica]QPI53557.1 hypothetical protein IV454_04950 [Massilia antarctica]